MENILARSRLIRSRGVVLISGADLGATEDTDDVKSRRSHPNLNTWRCFLKFGVGSKTSDITSSMKGNKF